MPHESTYCKAFGICLLWRGEVVNLTQFLFNFTSEIRTVKLGVFSFSPIAPVCGAVKLGGDIYRRYIPQIHNFTRCEGRGW